MVEFISLRYSMYWYILIKLDQKKLIGKFFLLWSMIMFLINAFLTPFNAIAATSKSLNNISLIVILVLLLLWIPWWDDLPIIPFLITTFVADFNIGPKSNGP